MSSNNNFTTTNVRRGGKLLPPVSFTPDAIANSTANHPHAPPLRKPSSSSAPQLHSNNPFTASDGDEDVGSLKHLSYTCPGLTDDRTQSTCHIESVPFSFIFGMPKDVLQKLLERDKRDAAAAAAAENSSNRSQPDGDGASSPAPAVAVKKDVWHSARTAANSRVAHKSTVTIPLYQRTYTWTSQGPKWFSDCVAKLGKYDNNAATSSNFSPADEEERQKKIQAAINMHGTGKVMLKKFENTGDDSDPCNWICVDGQQRITTMSLLFATLYEVACEIRHKVLGQQPNRSSSSSTSDLRMMEEAKSSLQGTCELLEQMLFSDPDAAKQWARSTFTAAVHKINSKNTKRKTEQKKQDAAENDEGEEVSNDDGDDDDAENELSSFWPEGVRVPGARLIPSFVDRQPFYELITRQLIFDENSNTNNTSSSVVDSDDISSTISSALLPQPGHFSAPARHSLQGKMMLEIFLPRVRSLIARQSASFLDSPLEAAIVQSKALNNFARHLLSGVGFVLVELVVQSRIAQIFLWMQEKSCFGMGALLFNPAPGVQFTASDLVRNLLMAPYMEERLSVQEEKHALLWLRPVEVPVRKAIKRLSMALAAAAAAGASTKKKDDGAITSADNEAIPTMDDACLLLVEQLEQEQLGSSSHVVAVAGDGGVDVDGSRDNSSSPPPLFRSSFHRKVEYMIKNTPAIENTASSKDKSGMIMYARLYSLFEYHLQKRLKAEKKKTEVLTKKLEELQRKEEEEEKREEEGKGDGNNNDGDEEESPISALTALVPKTRSVLEHERELCEWFLSRLAQAVPQFVQSLAERQQQLKKKKTNNEAFVAPAAIRGREE